MYSPRPGTPAAEMDDQVADEEKAERLQRLQALITRGQRAFNAAFAGRTLDVLLEKPGKLPGQLVGRSPYLQAVQVMAPRALIGSLAPRHRHRNRQQHACSARSPRRRNASPQSGA